MLKAFSELFESQLKKVSGSTDMSLGWGANLCGRIGSGKRGSNPSQQAMEAMNIGSQQDIGADDNCFLRIHIPFPAQNNHVNEPLETRSKDVVLFE